MTKIHALMHRQMSGRRRQIVFVSNIMGKTQIDLLLVDRALGNILSTVYGPVQSKDIDIDSKFSVGILLKASFAVFFTQVSI